MIKITKFLLETDPELWVRFKAKTPEGTSLQLQLNNMIEEFVNNG